MTIVTEEQLTRLESGWRGTHDGIDAIPVHVLEDRSSEPSVPMVSFLSIPLIVDPSTTDIHSQPSTRTCTQMAHAINNDDKYCFQH
jgi:hypothetical protein